MWWNHWNHKAAQRCHVTELFAVVAEYGRVKEFVGCNTGHCMAALELINVPEQAVAQLECRRARQSDEWAKVVVVATGAAVATYMDGLCRTLGLVTIVMDVSRMFKSTHVRHRDECLETVDPG